MVLQWRGEPVLGRHALARPGGPGRPCDRSWPPRPARRRSDQAARCGARAGRHQPSSSDRRAPARGWTGRSRPLPPQRQSTAGRSEVISLNTRRARAVAPGRPTELLRIRPLLASSRRRTTVARGKGPRPTERSTTAAGVYAQLLHRDLDRTLRASRAPDGASTRTPRVCWPASSAERLWRSLPGLHDRSDRAGAATGLDEMQDLIAAGRVVPATLSARLRTSGGSCRR